MHFRNWDTKKRVLQAFYFQINTSVKCISPTKWDMYYLGIVHIDTKRQRELIFFSLNKRRPQGDPTVTYNPLSSGCRKDGTKLFSEVYSERMRGKRQNWNVGNSTLISRNFFTMNIFKHWKRSSKWRWNLHPWRHAERGRARPWATCSPLTFSGGPFQPPWFWFYDIYRENWIKKILDIHLFFLKKTPKYCLNTDSTCLEYNSGIHEKYTICCKILARMKTVSSYWNQWGWKSENQVRRRWDYCHHTCNKLF